MAELRDSIKTNWATTGQELTRDFRQFWQTSRPASPARTPTQERPERDLAVAAASATSPSALSRLSHLEIPGRGQERSSSEFAAGYSLGLIGGVRSWVRGVQSLFSFLVLYLENPLLIFDGVYQMARSRRNLNDSRPPSPSDEGSSDEQQNESTAGKEPRRGRSSKQSEAMDVRA